MDYKKSAALAQFWDFYRFSTAATVSASVVQTSFSFWDGPVPDLNSAITNDTVLNLTTLLANLGLDSTKFIGATCPNDIQAGSSIFIDPTDLGAVHFRNSRSTNTMQAQKTGAPTLCLFLFAWAGATGTPLGGMGNNITYANFIAGSYDMVNGDTYIGILTAGDETSDAEVRLLGGQVTAGSAYRLSDFTINVAPAYVKN